MIKVAVATATRAEYGLLEPLMRELQQSPECVLQVMVSGAHLSEKFGNTVDVIIADGFEVTARIPIDIDADERAALGRGMGQCLGGFADALRGLAPDVLVILGDRYEMLSVAAAATIMGIPIAHLHGGEVTAGAMDDSIRHAITKLSHLHFVAAEEYARRVRQMGEMPENVHVVGALGLDAIAAIEPVSRTELMAEFGINDDRPYLLVTYHPETLSENSYEGLEAMLAALDRIDTHTKIITGVNADPGRDAVSERLHSFRERSPLSVYLFESLGQRRYVNAMRLADAVVGNSSSGIIEAPAVSTPTVNIGDRQKGRLRSASIVDCKADVSSIQAAIMTVLATDFAMGGEDSKPAYGRPGAASKTKDILISANLTHLSQKSFHDIQFEAGELRG